MTCKSSLMHLVGTLFRIYPYTLLDFRTQIEEGV